MEDIAIQGEFCGAGIQRTGCVLPAGMVCIYHDRSETHERLPLAKMQELCGLLELNLVPVEEIKDQFEYNSVEELLGAG